MSSTTTLDVTSIQGLVDIRNQLDRHAAPDSVAWHFAHISSRWTRRALAVAGFGFPAPDHVGQWSPIFSIASAGDARSVFEDGGRGVGDEEHFVGQQRDTVKQGQQQQQQQQQPKARKSSTKEEADEENSPVDSVGGGSELKRPATRISNRQTMLRAADPSGRLVPLTGVDRPYFHLNVESAVESALSNIRGRGLDGDDTLG